jgi:hypothetical protein
MEHSTRWGGKSPIAMIRRKGIHFDKPKKKKATYEELVAMDGLFRPGDIEERLPFSTDELLTKQADGSLCAVFYFIDGDHFLDLRALEAQLLAKTTILSMD